MDLKSFQELKSEWDALLIALKADFGIEPDLQAVLFLIGVQELGQGAKDFSKQEKQDLMHIAICRILSEFGYYKLLGIDEDGWPHWQHIKALPTLTLKEQDILLKRGALSYFKNEVGFPSADNN